MARHIVRSQSYISICLLSITIISVAVSFFNSEFNQKVFLEYLLNTRDSLGTGIH